MSLRLRIFLWLIPVLVPVCANIYLNYAAQRNAETERYMKMGSLTIAKGAKELNDYLDLKNTTFNILLEALLRFSIDPLHITPEADTQVGILLRVNPGFSMLAYADEQAKIQYAKVAANRSDLHLLPRDITGRNALSTDQKKQLLDSYLFWKQQVPTFRQQQQTIQKQLDQLLLVGEKNSLRYRRLQQKLVDLQMANTHPPVTVFWGGKELAEAAGLPFRADTFLFTVPLVKNEQEHAGFIVGILDWSIIEDKCFSFKTDLKLGGMPGADVMIYDVYSRRALLNQDKVLIETLRYLAGENEGVPIHVASENAYFVSNPVISAENLTRTNRKVILEAADVASFYQDSSEENLGYRLVAFFPDQDIFFYSWMLLKRSFGIVLLSIFWFFEDSCGIKRS